MSGDPGGIRVRVRDLERQVSQALANRTRLDPGAVPGDVITPGTITADLLSATLILASVIELSAGGYLETSTGNPKVRFDSSGLRAISTGGTTLVDLNAAGTFTIQSAATGQRIVLNGTALSAYDAVGQTVEVKADGTFFLRSAATGSRIRFDHTALQLIDAAGNTTVSLAAATGVFTLQSSASGARLVLTPSELAAYDASGQTVSITSAGAFTLQSAASGARLQITAAAINGYNASGNTYTLANDGTFTLRTGLAGSARVTLDSTGLKAIDASNVTQLHFDATNTRFIAGSLAGNYIKIDSGGIYALTPGPVEKLRFDTATGSITITGVLTAQTGSAIPVTYVTSGNIVSGTIITIDSGGRLQTAPPVTTTTTGSHTLPIATINAVATASFAAAGTIDVGGQTVTYTGKTGTTFTGCTGGTGTFGAGTVISQRTTQVVLDNAGVRAYDAAGANTFELKASDGSFIASSSASVIQGATIRTASTAGARVQMLGSSNALEVYSSSLSKVVTLDGANGLTLDATSSVFYAPRAITWTSGSAVRGFIQVIRTGGAGANKLHIFSQADTDSEYNETLLAAGSASGGAIAGILASRINVSSTTNSVVAFAVATGPVSAQTILLDQTGDMSLYRRIYPGATGGGQQTAMYLHASAANELAVVNATGSTKIIDASGYMLAYHRIYPGSSAGAQQTAVYLVAGAANQLDVTNAAGTTKLTDVNGDMTVYRRLYIGNQGTLYLSSTSALLSLNGDWRADTASASASASLINNTSASYTGDQNRWIVNRATSTAFNFLRCDSTSRVEFQMRGDGTIFAQVAFTVGSDRKLKENIRALAGGLSTVLSLKPSRFDRIGGRKDDAGFIAQEVRPLIPEAIDSVTQDDETTLTLAPDRIIPYMVSAIQELHAKIERLEEALVVVQ